MALKNRKFVALLCVIIFFAITLIGVTSCEDSPLSGDETNANEQLSTDEKTVRERVNEFYTAYNNGDMETVLSCLTVKKRNAFEAMFSLVGGLAGSYTGMEVDLSDLFSLGVSTASGDFMELDISDIKVSKSEMAVVTTKMELHGSGQQTIYFVLMYENNGWYINDITDKKVNITTGVTSQTSANIEVEQVGSLSRYDMAMVKFKMDDKTYVGLVNPEGVIYYYTEGEKLPCQSLGNGAKIVSVKEDGNVKELIFFNSKNERGATLDGDTFEAILGYENGLVLVYKNTSNISTEEHSYGIIDENGNWVSPMKPLPDGQELPNPNDSYTYWRDYEYAGEGVFISYNSYRGTVIYNSIKNEYFYFDGVIETDFANGVAYGCEIDSSHRIVGYFSIDLINGINEITEDEYIQNINKGQDYVISDGEYLQVYNAKTDIVSEYKNFPRKMIGYTWAGNYLLITINGADGKEYFTVIDKECNQLFEPIEYIEDWYVSIELSNGRIAYQCSEDVYEVVDLKGNRIISKEDGYTLISNFRNGLAYAKQGDQECYIGVDGKQLTIKLYE